MTVVSMVNNLELGDGADGRPLLRGLRKVGRIDESPWWLAQVDEQPHGPWSWDQCDRGGHVQADRKGPAGDLKVQFGRFVFGHRSTIPTS